MKKTDRDPVIVKFEKELKRKKRKERLHKIGQFIDHNKEIIMVSVPLVVGAVKGTAKFVGTCNRRHAANVEQRFKDTHIYDHSINGYVELRHKLSQKELKELVERREKSGKKVSEVLLEMNLVK